MPDLFLQLLVLFASLAVLVVSSRVVLNSSIKLARHLGMGEFAIGFMLVAVATCLPELGVTLNAAPLGEGMLVLGNVIGSNIADILLVLGFGAVAGSIMVRGRQLLNSAQILLLITMIPLILLVRGSIGAVSGLVLIIVFFIYAFFIFKSGTTLGIAGRAQPAGVLKAALSFALAMAILLISSHFAVVSAVGIASLIMIPASVMGLTAIALGTSLPELTVGITAVRHGHPQIAFGDIMGACVTNLTLILGIGAVITPITVDVVAESSLFFLLGVVAVLNFVLFRYHGINKTAGICFVLAYIAFLVWQMGLVSVV